MYILLCDRHIYSAVGHLCTCFYVTVLLCIRPCVTLMQDALVSDIRVTSKYTSLFNSHVAMTCHYMLLCDIYTLPRDNKVQQLHDNMCTCISCNIQWYLCLRHSLYTNLKTVIKPYAVWSFVKPSMLDTGSYKNQNRTRKCIMSWWNSPAHMLSNIPINLTLLILIPCELIKWEIYLRAWPFNSPDKPLSVANSLYFSTRYLTCAG